MDTLITLLSFATSQTDTPAHGDSLLPRPGSDTGKPGQAAPVQMAFSRLCREPP